EPGLGLVDAAASILGVAAGRQLGVTQRDRALVTLPPDLLIRFCRQLVGEVVERAEQHPPVAYRHLTALPAGDRVGRYIQPRGKLGLRQAEPNAPLAQIVTMR